MEAIAAAAAEERERSGDAALTGRAALEIAMLQVELGASETRSRELEQRLTWQAARHDAIVLPLTAQREHEASWWRAEMEAERRRLMEEAISMHAEMRAEMEAERTRLIEEGEALCAGAIAQAEAKVEASCASHEAGRAVLGAQLEQKNEVIERLSHSNDTLQHEICILKQALAAARRADAIVRTFPSGVLGCGGAVPSGVLGCGGAVPSAALPHGGGAGEGAGAIVGPGAAGAISGHLAGNLGAYPGAPSNSKALRFEGSTSHPESHSTPQTAPAMHETMQVTDALATAPQACAARLHEANAILKARLEAINQQSAYRRAL